MVHAPAMELTADQRRRAMQSVGILFLAVGVGTHAYERRTLRLRVAAKTISLRTAMRLEEPGAVTAIIGLAALTAAGRVTRDG
jgi:hypothetical protein